MEESKGEHPRLLVATEAAVCNKNNLVNLTFNLLMLSLGWVACLTQKGRMEQGMGDYPTFQSMFSTSVLYRDPALGAQLLAALSAICQRLFGHGIQPARAERKMEGIRYAKLMADRKQQVQPGLDKDFQKPPRSTCCSSSSSSSEEEEDGGPLSMQADAAAQLGTVYNDYGGIVSVNLVLRYAVDLLRQQRNCPSNPPPGVSFQQWMHTEIYHRLKAHHFLKARAAFGFEKPKDTDDSGAEGGGDADGEDCSSNVATAAMHSAGGVDSAWMCCCTCVSIMAFR
jgi:hypothetical protein